jgi:hypothetical protein
MLGVAEERKIEETHLFLGSEIVYDVEQFPDLFRSLAFDHVRHGLAADVTVAANGQ